VNDPSIEHTARDEGNNITFRVMAYRQMTDEEVLEVVADYLDEWKGPRIQNQTITIMTMNGFLPGM
jgi:hypothetical protein